MSENARTPSIPDILAECYTEVYDPDRAFLRRQYPHYYPLSRTQELLAECYMLLRDDSARHLTRQGETDADKIAERLLTLGCAGNAKAVESIFRTLANNPDPTLLKAVYAALKTAISAASYKAACVASGIDASGTATMNPCCAIRIGGVPDAGHQTEVDAPEGWTKHAKPLTEWAVDFDIDPRTLKKAIDDGIFVAKQQRPKGRRWIFANHTLPQNVKDKYSNQQ